MKKSNILYINKKVDVLRPDSKEKEFCMETVRTKKSKFLVILIVFMMLFSNCGYTIAAIATSDEFQVINNGFFKKDEIKFNAYFEDENGNQMDEFTGNVNQKVKLVLEVLPQVEGYLKNATIKAVSADDDNINFRISNVSQNVIEGLEANSNSNLDDVGSKIEEEAAKEESQDPAVEESKEETNTVVNENTNVSENVQQNENSENTVTEVVKNEVANEVTNETNNANNETTNAVTNEITNSSNDTSNNNVVNETEISEVVNETVANETVIEENNIVNQEANNVASDSVVSEEDELVNEEEVIIEKTEAADKLQQEIANAALDISLIADDKIKLTNIIEDTKIIADLEYIQGETLKVSDLYKNIKLQISGTYINSDLEEVQIGKEEEVTLGWEYSKDIELTSEYTKFSPFEIGDIKGTIVENKISVKREITDTKYLPIKSTKLEITVPKVNGKAPIEVDVVANKLMATRGEDTGYTNFTQANWNYDKESGKIFTVVENTEALNTNGIDEYVVIYRYEDYISEENSNLDKVVKASVEEYSSNENNILTKEINDRQSIKIDVGELITYNISSTEDKINKAKIYANYNSETPVYETEYTTQVNVNILTSDILEELKIDSTKEYYITSNNLELQAQGIEYKQIKFNYSEISSILSAGGEIVITNANGELLYTLNSSLVTKEEDCTINLNGANGILVYARNIAKNGNISFELTKAIKNCNYEKSTFKDITQIESRITAEVKYQAIEETLALGAIGTRKEFEESSTSATLSINKETLTTIQDNNNVELKIELNNDKENSDLYVNPTFELVFPKYVKAVSVQSINLLYENGLQVSDFNTYTESDIVKMRIELVGTQKTFSESSITNGTNIVVNVNIEVDDYTPSKEDQIKLYYYNEGVSNYQSQTKWTINKQIPNGILKTTNGFDVALIKYQAPKGLIAINGIVNYDGNLSEIRSVKQGKVTKQIAINGPARVATMELLALNNTENECSDLVLIGRVPFKGNKDVISNEDLGTTTDTIVRDLIKEDIQNSNMSTIYYSTNPNATKDLNNEANGWTTEVTDPSTIKSYLIVVNGKLKAGEVLRYTYDFEIPANLPYETSIAGSFGAYYNNNTDVAVVYESSSADIVGLTTEAGPKMEAKLSVDVGDGTEVGEARFLNYTLKVKNTGSIAATEVTVTNPIPNNTLLYVYDTSDLGLGNNNYVESKEQSDLVWTIDTLNPNEEKEFNYMVKVDRLRGETEKIIKSKATVSAKNLGITFESNETSNKMVKSNLDLQINTDSLGEITVGRNLQFKVLSKNISGNILENVRVECKLPSQVTYKEIIIDHDEGSSYNEESVVYDENTHTVSFNIDKLDVDGFFNIKVGIQIVSASDDVTHTYMSFYMNDGTEERTSNSDLKMIGPKIETKQVANADYVLEGDLVEFAIQIDNTGTDEATGLRIVDEISEYLEDVRARYTGSSNSQLDIKDGKIDAGIAALTEGGKIVLTISGTAKDLPEGVKEQKISNQAIISGDYINTINTEVAEVIIQENPNKPEEENPNDDNKDDDFNNIENGDGSVDDDSNNNNDNNPTTPETPNNDNNTNNDNNSDNNNGNNNNNSNNNLNNNNNNTNNNQNNNNQNNNQQNNVQKVEEKIYSISGKVWLDSNQDGKNDADEEKLATIKIQLQKDGKMLKAVTSDGNGEYKFEELEKGTYNIIFVYDGAKYTATTYKATGTTENDNSDALETEEGSAVTNELVIADTNLGNIDLGLKLRDTFDLGIEKYLTKAKVTTNKGEKEYDFDNEKLSKIEIRAKELNGATVELEYNIVVENTGLVEGYATKVTDVLPKDMNFDESKNEGWYLGSDGMLYNESLKDTVVKPGEKKELRLVLTRQMNSDNTGVLSNKAILEELQNVQGLQDDANNNVSTHEILILVGTGGRTVAIIGSIVAIILAIVLYTNRDKLKLSKKYKNNVNKKIKPKKIYK